MLTKLYRFGPCRQRLTKAYVIWGNRSRDLVKEVIHARSKLLIDSPIQICGDRRNQQAICLDTGMVWWHKPECRRQILNRLLDSVRRVSEFVSDRGGKLLPNAVLPDGLHGWQKVLCGDTHFFEIGNLAEKEVFCNLLRLHSPELIALTGRAGVSSFGVDSFGSRRLTESGHHFASPYLPSVSSRYLDCMLQCLRRDFGIAQLDLLDINPQAQRGEESSPVELRFTDGQMLLTTARSHAILYQALFIRARLMVHAGVRIFPSNQDHFERNRTQVIAKGLGAQLTTSSGNHRGFVFKSALSLIRDLAFEFQTLETEYSEIAPLVLGLYLRNMGCGGLRNESDRLRTLFKVSRHEEGGSFIKRIQEEMTQECEPIDRITRWNCQTFPERSQIVRDIWEGYLSTDTIPRLESQTPRDLISRLLNRPPNNRKNSCSKSRSNSSDRPKSKGHPRKPRNRRPKPNQRSE